MKKKRKAKPMKVPDKYEPRTKDEFGVFSEALKRIMSVPYSEIKERMAEDKSERTEKRAKKSASRDEA